MATRTSEKTTGAKDGKGRQMFSTRIDMPQDTRKKMVDLLNQQLADTFDLYSLTKQAHWNVKGPQFFQLHELYDLLAEGILPFVDAIAERITALSGVANGTARMAASSSRLEDLPATGLNSLESVRMLADRYATLAKSTREGIDTADKADDMDTADLLTEVSRDLDKYLWFLEAHLQGED